MISCKVKQFTIFSLVLPVTESYEATTWAQVRLNPTTPGTLLWTVDMGAENENGKQVGSFECGATDL